PQSLSKTNETCDPGNDPPQSPPHDSEPKRKKKKKEFCPRCKRVVCTRAAECEKCGKWWHYHCDRLSPEEIHRLDKDKGFIYICKSCRSSENTEAKVIADAYPVTQELKNSNQTCDETTLKKLKIPIPYPKASNSDTCAAAILHEESADLCCVCDSQIDNDANRCSICNLLCHNDCVCRGQGDDDLCLTCAANQVQRTDAQLGDSPPPASQQQTDSGTLDYSDDPGQQLTQTQNHNNESTVNPNETKTTQSKANKGPKEKKPPQDTAGVKQRELRQKELKLKKWEEELKIREAKTAELEGDKSRLEDYICKTEARNVELEATIRTLQRRISVLENRKADDIPNSSSQIHKNFQNPIFPGLSTHNDQHPNQNYYYPPQEAQSTSSAMRANEELLYGIQQQVNRFILQKVAHQFQQLELLDKQNQQSAPHIVQQTQTQCINDYPSQNRMDRGQFVPNQGGPQGPAQQAIPVYGTDHPQHQRQDWPYMPMRGSHSHLQPNIDIHYQRNRSVANEQIIVPDRYYEQPSTAEPSSQVAQHLATECKPDSKQQYPVKHANPNHPTVILPGRDKYPRKKVPESNNRRRSEIPGVKRESPHTQQDINRLQSAVTASGHPLFYTPTLSSGNPEDSNQTFLWNAGPHRRRR
ncbi:MAG: hypothetical protein JAY74_18145, partial [Candidatus Thiodiazotropha taylori]|nr:hypothetical protein [Candidatus Thiodiazotropha taylori]